MYNLLNSLLPASISRQSKMLFSVQKIFFIDELCAFFLPRSVFFGGRSEEMFVRRLTW